MKKRSFQLFAAVARIRSPGCAAANCDLFGTTCSCAGNQEGTVFEMASGGFMAFAGVPGQISAVARPRGAKTGSADRGSTAAVASVC
jgi:hypothetical protein